ncbi:subtilisin family serine protease [Peribacillus deserti]|uniref:Subtilisin family serine protease n=1 Tax=Peribacillus deserti TaxID=673318 RepID=A0ABS2QCF7_9BACI|nr:S8 family serine peptidase [Peribacillus deserti]MBM7690846.1 subtilisin family serine protease [Peribacillus deserti]
MLGTFYKLMAPLALTTALVSIIPQVTLADENADRRQKTFYSGKEVRTQASAADLASVNDRQAIIKSSKPIKGLLAAYNLTLVNQFKSGHETLYIIKIPTSHNYNLVLKKALQYPGVTTAEPNYVKKHFAAAAPNDKYAAAQWYLPKLGIPDAWESYTFTHPVKIAVLDTGIHYDHPDFAAGQILPGYDFVNDDADPLDYAGHGTMVSGVIAAQANNQIGIAGVAAKNTNIKILPVKIGSAKGAEIGTEILGIDYAIKQGADIINISFGSEEPSQAEYDAISRAVSKGILVVASAGNEGEYKFPVSFPAAYPEVLSVGSTDSKDKLSTFSNTGEALDLAAPGENIAVPTRRGGYDLKAAGTSFSAPIVSGLAGLMLSADKTLEPYEIEYLLERSANKPPGYTSFWNKYTGFGRVNIMKAMQTSLPVLSKDTGDLRTRAKAVSVNKSYIDKFDTPLDSDWYVLKAVKNMKIKVDVSAVSYTDPVIWTDRLVSGKPAEEKEHDAKRMSSGESFTISIKPGSNYFQLFEKNNHFSPNSYSLKITELDTTAPGAPYVYTVNSKSTVIKGKAEKGSTVRIYYGTKLLRTTKATTAGTFSTAITKQPAGRILTATATDLAGNKSKTTKITIKI